MIFASPGDLHWSPGDIHWISGDINEVQVIFTVARPGRRTQQQRRRRRVQRPSFSSMEPRVGLAASMLPWHSSVRYLEHGNFLGQSILKRDKHNIRFEFFGIFYSNKKNLNAVRIIIPPNALTPVEINEKIWVSCLHLYRTVISMHLRAFNSLSPPSVKTSQRTIY